MKLLSYNIWNYSGGWRIRRELLLRIILAELPDVIALQEVRHTWHDAVGQNQARWLGERAGYRWIYRPANLFFPFPPVAEGLAFLTRTKLDSFSVHPVPKLPWAGPRRIILHARVEGVDLYNVHFPLTDRARIVEARTLIDLVERRDTGRSIALGDFNARAGQPPMKLLWDAGFSGLSGTDDASAAGVPGGSEIDYILGFRPTWRTSLRGVGIEPTQAGVLPSDHPGLIAEIDF